jgi:ABC-type sugar transport system ATPase subunit
MAKECESLRWIQDVLGDGQSSELPEVLAMSDRVVVIQEGRTAGALAHAEATAERVMDLATGGR